MRSKKHCLALTNLTNEISKDLLENSMKYLSEKHFYCLQIYENRSKASKELNI